MGSSRGRGQPKKTVSPPPKLTIPQTTQPEQSQDTNEPHAKQHSQHVEALMGTKEQAEQRKLWVDVLNDNRNPSKGVAMKYVPPSIVAGEIQITIEDEDVATELKFWENSLIMYVLGGDLSMNTVKNFMERMWNFIKLPDIHYHEEGYFILKFQSHMDMDQVISIINDRNGAKLVQPIEYEWKPKFCEQCQRFGHICEAPKPVKVWQPKQKQKAEHVRIDDVERMTPAMAAAEPSSTPTTEGTNLHIQKNANLENWTTSTKSGRDKHKSTPKDKVLLNCTNGFGLLGDMNVSKMLVDGDPC
ncbi:unnamed protein product [Lathyrus sativus]|nr:unnamed protein product [Lathyrus sativus]